MKDVIQLTTENLVEGMEKIKRSPSDNGIVEMIVIRPQTDEREVLNQGVLDVKEGLVGDRWSKRDRSQSIDSPSNPDTQLTLINSRVVSLLAQQKERWSLAGDQFYVDLDLSTKNLPAGSRLAIGDGIIEITAEPHTGCQKFVERYGKDAMIFVNSAAGRRLNLRGIYAKVIQPGVILVGDVVKKQ